MPCKNLLETIHQNLTDQSTCSENAIEFTCPFLFSLDTYEQVPKVTANLTVIRSGEPKKAKVAQVDAIIEYKISYYLVKPKSRPGNLIWTNTVCKSHKGPIDFQRRKMRKRSHSHRHLVEMTWTE